MRRIFIFLWSLTLYAQDSGMVLRTSDVLAEVRRDYRIDANRIYLSCTETTIRP